MELHTSDISSLAPKDAALELSNFVTIITFRFSECRDASDKMPPPKWYYRTFWRKLALKLQRKVWDEASKQGGQSEYSKRHNRMKSM